MIKSELIQESSKIEKCHIKDSKVIKVEEYMLKLNM